MDYSRKISERQWNLPDKGELESRREATYIDDIMQKDHIQRKLLENLDGIRTVFDGGAGCGRFSILLAKRGCHVTHFDISQPMIDKAKELAAAEGVSDRIRFVKGALEDLSAYADRSFDLVISFDAPISYTYPDQYRVIGELVRIARKRVMFSVSSRLGSLPYLCNPVQKNQFILHEDSDDPFVRWCVENREKLLQAFRFDRKQAEQVLEDGLLGGQREIEAYEAGQAPWCITYTFLPDELERVLRSHGVKNIRLSGPGAVTTAAMLGANYGYSLIWLMFPIIFMGITFVMTTNWLAITTGMPTIHAIRKYFGKAGAIIVGIALFLACLFFTMGNISGTGAGMELIFGLNWKLGSLILICVVVYTYFAKNVYSKVEKLITACIIIMIAAFYITLFGVSFKATGENGVVGFEGGKFFGGLFGFQIPEGSLGTALAFISTNAAITTGIYNTYLGKEKKWKRDDLFNGVMFTDALVHMISVVLISGAIILVGAIVLNPQGLAIKAPKQLAQMLEPIMGPAAKYIMGFALVGAGFSSLLANTQRGMVLLGAGIEKDFGLESKFIRFGCLICLAIAMAICYSFNGSPTELILIANIATSIATPIGGLFVLLLIWRKDVNEGYKAPTALRICMTISYIFVLIMTVSAFQKTIIPGIMKLFA